jgi:hypothetical protein
MITAAEIQTIRDNDPGAVLPGIDTMTGNPYATSSLLDVTKITQNKNAPYYYSPSQNYVYVTQPGAVLSGINFGDATVIIDANDVTIKDCTFTATSSFWAINQPNASGATVENCTFTGSKSPTEKNVWITSALGITIKDNTFLNSPADTIAIQQGVVTGNYMSGEGYGTLAHGDAIYIPDTTGPVTISDNFIEETPNAGAQGFSNSDLRITTEFGNTNDVTVTGNYLIGSGFVFEAGTPNSSYTMSNVSITGNDVGFEAFGQYYPGTTDYATSISRIPPLQPKPLRTTSLQRRMWCLGAQAGAPPAGRRQQRSWATVMCRRIWVCLAPAKRILSAVWAHNCCLAVRARTFLPISPLAMAATERTHSIQRRT